MKESFFSPLSKSTSHIVIPTSVVHTYKIEEEEVNRNAIYIKKYGLTHKEKNPIIFFHGGPGIANENQFDYLIEYFAQKGHGVYVPEIEGSGMYTYPDRLPIGFDITTVPENLKLLGLQKSGASGLNEFTQNYADDVKDVICYISKEYPEKKMNVIAHSLGCHQLLRTLQHFTDLNQKIGAICNIAGTYDVGITHFWVTLHYPGRAGCFDDYQNNFYLFLKGNCTLFLKSEVNEHEPGPAITETNNPALDPEMNKKISVHYGHLDCFPPMFLIHAKDDVNVFFQNSILLAEKIQQAHCVVGGLFLETGGHHFIKDEGIPEIRLKAFNAINNFFQEPSKAHFQESLSEINYENVVAQHQSFLEQQEACFRNYYRKTLESTYKI